MLISDEDWIHKFFGGRDDFYGTYYRQAIDFTLTDKNSEEQVEKILRLLKPEAGAHILDWCGGWGRHAIPLAERGFRVTLLDFCREYLEMAEEEARRRGLVPGDSFRTVRSDFRRTPASIQADYAINLFSAGLGYFTERDDVKALRALVHALRPNGKILIDTMNLFWIVRNFRESDFQSVDDGKKRFLTERWFDFLSNRLYASYIFEDKEKGTEVENRSVMRLYSPRELVRVLGRSGFEPLELYGGLDGSPFGFDSKRIVLIAQKK